MIEIRSGRRQVAQALIVSSALFASVAFAADPDIARAQELVRSGQYQDAYSVLSPFESASVSDADFNYLLGRSALGTQQPDKAKALFQRSLAARPDFVPSHLGLGRAYFALGEYADAKIEFETVLRFENLPPDVRSQAEVYDQAARQTLDGNRPLSGFGYAETGIGQYRENETVAGGGDRRDTFYNARVGGGVNYALQNGYAIDSTLDYRYRYYDNSGRRSDSDLRWRLAGSKAFGENNLAAGFRGRTSYRGDGNYRNDVSIFADYRLRYDPDNQFTLGGEIQRRRYPEGPERDISRSTASLSAGWMRSFMDGKGSFSIRGNVGRNYATTRGEGDSNFYGATASLDYTLGKTLSLGGFVWWEHGCYSIGIRGCSPGFPDVNGDQSTDKIHLYEVGTYLVWEFSPTWTLRPELLWIRDKSDTLHLNYSSTEFWVNVRKSF